MTRKVQGGYALPVSIEGVATSGDLSNMVYPAFIPTGSDQGLTIDATAGGVEFAAFPAGTTHVFITWDTADSRFTLDNSAPTTSNGHFIPLNSADIWPVEWANAAKFIRTGTTSAYAHATPLKAV